MKLLILGATGRTGRRVVMAARAQGHETVAYGRQPADGADRNVVGRFDDPAFADAVRASDAVVSCLASTNAEPVCSTAAKAAITADPTLRFLTIAGAVWTAPGIGRAWPTRPSG